MEEFNLTIRQARDIENDCDFIFSLSNDPLVRSNSFNTKPIEYASHCKYFEKTIAEKNTLSFLVLQTKARIPLKTYDENLKKAYESLG